MKNIFIIALIVSSSYAAEPPCAVGTRRVIAVRECEGLKSSPSAAPKFLTRTQLLALSINAGSMAADIMTSRSAIARGGHEANPLMGRSSAIAFKIGEVALVTVISYQLYRHGHVKLARILPLMTASPSVFAAIHNSGVK